MGLFTELCGLVYDIQCCSIVLHKPSFSEIVIIIVAVVVFLVKEYRINHCTGFTFILDLR